MLYFRFRSNKYYMRFTIALLLTALLAFAAGLYFDWWIIAVAGFLVALLVGQRPGRSFLAGFLGVFLLWAGMSAWIDIQNEHILAARIAHLMPLKGSILLLIVVTGIIGGLVAGLGALSGSYLRRPRNG